MIAWPVLGEVLGQEQRPARGQRLDSRSRGVGGLGHARDVVRLEIEFEVAIGLADRGKAQAVVLSSREWVLSSARARGRIVTSSAWSPMSSAGRREHEKASMSRGRQRVVAQTGRSWYGFGQQVRSSKLLARGWRFFDPFISQDPQWGGAVLDTVQLVRWAAENSILSRSGLKKEARTNKVRGHSDFTCFWSSDIPCVAAAILMDDDKPADDKGVGPGEPSFAPDLLSFDLLGVWDNPASAATVERQR